MTGSLRVSGKPGFSRSGLTVAGFSLAEALIALAITATVATLAIGVLVGNNPKTTQSYGRSAADFVTHLSTVCKKAHLEYGAGPHAATTIDGSGVSIYAYPKLSTERTVGTHDDKHRGFPWILKDWESTVTYNSGDESLSYPENMRLYLQPDMSNASSAPDVDPSGEIPDNSTNLDGTCSFDPEAFVNFPTDCTGSPKLPTDMNDIMYNSGTSPDLAYDDRKFVMLDMNGTTAPNSLASTGDRVLLYIEDKTCRIRTAHQACRDGTNNVDMDTCNQAYGQSFYDVFKCDEAKKQGLDTSHCGTSDPDYLAE